MKTFIQGPRVHLRKLTISDATENYVGWLNNPMINRYLESRFNEANLESVQTYINTCNSTQGTHLFGIYESEKRHIGNIKIGPINAHHGFGDIGILIGEPDSQGKGYATEAIQLLCDFAFNQLSLHKATASMYVPNVGSYKAFLKAGFVQEGLLRGHALYKNQYVDVYILGKRQT